LRVADIFTDAKKTCANVDTVTVLGFISDAIEILSNKGAWDARKVYLSLPIQAQNLVTLPSFVESALKVNIDNTPTFSRDRIYEFSLNGPGSTTQRTDFSWEDRGFVPTLVSITPGSRMIVAASAADVGLKVVVSGLDSNNKEISETILIGASNVASVNTYSSLLNVSKDVTTNQILLYSNPSLDGVTLGNLLSTYNPFETDGKYRQIRLSKTGLTARMLVIRKTSRVNSQDDFIPVVSRYGLLLMIKALMAYGRTDKDTGAAYEELAIQKTTEAQQSQTSFAELAKSTEMDSPRGLNYNNRDSIIVADIYDEACMIVGPLGQLKVFDKITEAVEALHNKGNWDGLVGYVDILTDGTNTYVTLPRYVESPIAINLGGMPMFMQNKWFEFHLNGPGSSCDDLVRAWQWVGDTRTSNPLTYVVQITAIPDNSVDDGKSITIYGLDDVQKQLMTGTNVGYTFTMDHTKVLPLVNDQKISRIDRIVRDPTSGFVRLMGFSTDQTLSTQLGYWYPDETEPLYNRIKLPRFSTWVRMRYRKRTLKVSSLTDPIHLRSKLSICTMLRSIEALNKGDLNAAPALESKALQFLSEEQMSRNPGESFDLQFSSVSFGDNYILV
jgi:hypothetical protein